MRNILATLGGLASAILVFILFEMVGSSVFPTPPGFDYNDAVAMQLFVDSLPIEALLLVLLGYVVGSFLCGLVLAKLARNEKKVLPLIAGGILTLAGFANVINIKHSIWFSALVLIVFIPCVLVGYKLVRRRG
jgi:hypothetical protein